MLKLQRRPDLIHPCDELAFPSNVRLSQFDSQYPDIHRACSYEDADGCWLLDATKHFNFVLKYVYLELKQVNFNRLGILFMNLEVMNYTAKTDSIRDAYIVFYMLLMLHPCIEHADFTNIVLHSARPENLRCALSCNQGLHWINFSFIFIGNDEEHAKYLSSISELRNQLKTVHFYKLRFSCEPSFVEWFATQSQLQTLELVCADMNDSTADKIFGTIFSKCLNLREVYIANTQIGTGGVRALSTFLQRNTLKTLSLESIRKLTPKDTSLLANGIDRNQSLCTLRMFGWHLVGEKGFSFINAIAKHPSITILKLVSCYINLCMAKSFTNILCMNTVLQHVDISCNTFKGGEVAHIANALKINKTLRILVLYSNNMTSACAATQINALKFNNTLIELHMAPLYVNLEIKNALHSTNSYHRVRMHYPPESVCALARSIEMHASSVTSVDLYCPYIDSNCLTTLFNALCKVAFLDHLELIFHMKMDSRCTLALAKLLSEARSLKLISLQVSSICNMVSSLEALSNNRTVTYCDVLCTLSPDVEESFLNMLAKNVTLQHFGRIRAEAQTLYSIADALLKTNVTIESMQIDRDCDFDAICAIKSALCRNKRIFYRAVGFANIPEKFESSVLHYELFKNTDTFKTALSKNTHDSNILYRRAECYIAYNFFRLIGVCKGMPQCFPLDSTQIDSLNVYCLAKICSYLELSSFFKQL